MLSDVPFQIDEKKLAQALPPPTSSTWEDLKWSTSFLGLMLFWPAWLIFIGWLLLRALA